MFSTKQEVLAWLNSFKPHGIKPGTQRMVWMLERLNHPERRIKVVHIGGTNGKGSTLNYLRNILQEAEYSVGSFTSPYIETFNERIMINGEFISDKSIVEAANLLLPQVETLLEDTSLGEPTEFELVTMLALIYFASIKPCDVVLMEVGLGGRLDSTNVVHPLITLLTNVGLDHTKFLGDNHETIAREKAGIIKNGVPVITTATQIGLDVFKSTAKERQSSIYTLGETFTYIVGDSNQFGESFKYRSLFTQKWVPYSINMAGHHQVINAALAIMAAEVLKTFYAFSIDSQAISAGLNKAVWPGRCECVSEKPLVLLDGAHNSEGIQSLTKTIQRKFSDYRIVTIFSSMKDKPNREMVGKISRHSDEMIFPKFEFPRAEKPEVLSEYALSDSKQVTNDWRKTLTDKTNELDDNSLLLICGSLYFISEVRNYLLNLKKELNNG